MSLLILVALPLFIMIVVMIPFVQNGLVNVITNRLSADLGTEVSIRKASVLPFIGVNLRGILVRDKMADTLFYAGSARVKIERISFKEREIQLGVARLHSPKVNISGTEDGMNFSFIIDSLQQNRDTLSARWSYAVRGLMISGGEIAIEHPSLNGNSGLNGSLLVSSIELDSRISTHPDDSLVILVKSLSASEATGLELKNFRASAHISDNATTILDAAGQTAQSSFNISRLEIPTGNNEVSGNTTGFRCDITTMAISSEEIRLFIPDFPVIEDEVNISGLVYGNRESLNGNQVTISVGDLTRLVTTFDLSGLSNLNEAFVYMDVESFQTTAADIELFLKGAQPLLPPFVNQLGTVKYSGNITGFINDIVAFGSFSSNLGVVDTDLGLKLLPGNELVYAGLVNTSNFHLGRLFNLDPQLRQVSFSLEVSGNRRSPTDYFVFMDGNIESIDFNDYLYRNIVVQGLLRHQMFDGRVNIDDPNGQLDFLGKVDLSGQVPHFNFNAEFRNLLLDNLNILPRFEGSALTFSMSTNFEGDNLDDLLGEITLSNGLLFSPKASIDFDSLSVRAGKFNSERQLVLESPFASGTITGNYSLRNLRHYFLSFIANYLPSSIPIKYHAPLDFNNSFNFDFRFYNISELMSILVSDLQIADNGHFRGHYTHYPASLELDAALEFLNFKGFTANDLKITASTREGEGIGVTLNADTASYGKLLNLANFTLHQTALNDTLVTNLFWNNWAEVAYSGGIYTTTLFSVDDAGKRLSRLFLHPSAIVVANTPWILTESSASLHDDGFSIDNFRIGNHDQYVTVNGLLDKQRDDGMQMVISGFNLANFQRGQTSADLLLSGEINGELHLSNYFREPVLTSNLEVDNLLVNEVAYGLLRLNSSWNPESEAVVINTSLVNNETQQLKGTGLFHPANQTIDFLFDVERLGIEFLNPIIGEVLHDLSGFASGKLYFKGPLQKPYLSGRVNLDGGKFNVGMLQTSYNIRDSVIFYPNEIRFSNMRLADQNNRTGRFSGSIFHDGNFTDMVYNLRVEANNMLLLNTTQNDNPYFHGNVFGTALLSVTGDDDNLNIAISGRTEPNTRFNITMQPTQVASESNFIRFTSNGTSPMLNQPLPVEREYQVDITGVRLDMDIQVMPEAQVQIIFEGGAGDILRSTGNGNIQVRIDRQGNLRLFGTYTINEGDYLFSLQNLINKRFIINQGGTVQWSGDPGNAEIDITAVYRLKASLNELVGPMTTTGVGNGANWQRRVQIHCNLMLSGQLQQPSIAFGLEMPNLDESREALILDLISTEDEINRQVLSLLILNRFYTPDHLRMTEGTTSRQENAALIATTTDMLSSQLSRWLSSFSHDVDIGLAYHPGDHLTQEEVEVALSTQVFNNRVTFNGNVGYGKYFTNTSNLVGDFDMDVKLNRSGTIRARVYTRTNESLIYEVAPTTQGIGLSFREEFNSFRELLNRYWVMVTGRPNNN